MRKGWFHSQNAYINAQPGESRYAGARAICPGGERCGTRVGTNVGFCDLHSHILPGLDDGAPDPAASMAIIRGLCDLGFDTVCATPHQKAAQYLPSLEAIATAHAETRARVDAAGLELAIPLAVENMWDDVFFGRFEAGTIPSYDDGDAFLVEFNPSFLPIGLTGHIFSLRMRGKLPVIAHPERYEPLWDDDDMVEALMAECAFVIDLGAVAGHHGRKRGKVARKMLERGKVHAVASDSHRPEDVGHAAEGIAWIRKKLGAAAVTRLLDENPRRILAGEHPEG